MSVDVVMLTKDSEHVLEESLSAVYENVPVNNLIIVDGLSTDKTLDILRKYHTQNGNVKIINDRGTRATARQKGIENVETEWFMFVDSDVIICKDWYKKAMKHVNEADDVGAVWGVNVDTPNINSRAFLRMITHTATEIFKFRGGTHDILILRDSVKDIKIPAFLHAYEDKYITDWIQKKGYEVVIGDELYCLHYRPPSDWALKESVNLASQEIKYGLVHFHTFKYMFYYPFYTFYWFVQNFKKALPF